MWKSQGVQGQKRLFLSRREGKRRRKVARRLLVESLERRELLASDFLYVADAFSDSVHKFDADTSAHLGSFVASGSAGLHGPRGMVFDQGSLLVVNQNIDLPKNGEVLRYNSQTGAPVGALVPFQDTNAPFSPAELSCVITSPMWPTHVRIRLREESRSTTPRPAISLANYNRRDFYPSFDRVA